MEAWERCDGYQHSSARYYINGKHAGYEVVDVERILSEKDASGPESLTVSNGTFS